MTVTIDKLRKLHLFKDLIDREVEVIAEYANEERYPAGRRIFEEKALATNLYLVIEGKVSIRMGEHLLAKQLEVDTVGPGEIFGWSAITEPYTFTAAAWTLEETTVIVISGDVLRHIFESNCYIGYPVMRGIASIISGRLRSVREEVVKLLQKP